MIGSKYRPLASFVQLVVRNTAVLNGRAQELLVAAGVVSHAMILGSVTGSGSQQRPLRV